MQKLLHGMVQWTCGRDSGMKGRIRNVLTQDLPHFFLAFFLMNEKQLITKTQRLFIAMLAFFPWVAGCTDLRPPKPPLFVPFEAQKAGSTYTTELRVMEHRNYLFSLLLKDKKGATMEDAIQFTKLADILFIPLKLKISVIETSGERIIYDKKGGAGEVFGSGGMGVEKSIDVIELRPGRYRVSIQSLKDTPELAENPITFGIYGRPNFSPID